VLGVNLDGVCGGVMVVGTRQAYRVQHSHCVPPAAICCVAVFWAARASPAIDCEVAVSTRTTVFSCFRFGPANSRFGPARLSKCDVATDI